MGTPVSCARCGRVGISRAFWLEDTRRRHLACLRCTLTNGRLLRQSLGIAAVVGTILVAINQGNVIVAGTWPGSLAWKIPLTYAVPFTVAMWSALNTLRGSRPPRE
jgi:hypothetical protein